MRGWDRSRRRRCEHWRSGDDVGSGGRVSCIRRIGGEARVCRYGESRDGTGALQRLQVVDEGGSRLHEMTMTADGKSLLGLSREDGGVFGWRVANGQLSRGVRLASRGCANECGDEVAVARKRSGCSAGLATGRGVLRCWVLCLRWRALQRRETVSRLRRRSAWRSPKSSADEWEAGCAGVSSRCEEWILPVDSV